jgi:protocatechuate 3,4-dioxygenase beta subunit
MTKQSIQRAPRLITRRSLLHELGTGVIAGPLIPLLACTDDGAGTDYGMGTDDDMGTEGDTGDACGTASEWASGGTAAMTAKDCYPDPFAAGVMTCALFCSTTAGPCTADTIERQDVSEGLPGLPVRLALKIVDADTCEPVAGAVVEIWHTQRSGVYSGETPGGAQCSLDDPDAPNQLYFRGSQTTDDDGRVDFDTCYPGWYSGRPIHIHFRVQVDGQSHLTSQLLFPDELSKELFEDHPDYLEFGQPDTLNDEDSVFRVEDLSPYVLDTAQMPDGALLAWKLVAIRSSLADPLCSAEG